MLQRWSLYGRRMVMLQRWCLMEVLHDHGTEEVTITKRKWSCYGGGQFKCGRTVMLQRWSVSWREHGHVTEEAN